MIPEIGFVQQCLSSVWPEWKINRILGTITAGAVYEISRGNSGDAEAGTLKFLYMENNPDLFSMNMQSVINMMLQLKGHPHIASIVDYSIRKNEKACIVMIRTERLLLLPERMRLAPLKREDVIRLGLDICNALSFCEQKQAIHGNIEINTIYYSEKTGFKLDDFMLFRAVFSAQEETFTDGINSLLYLAPEVYLNGKADNKSDIYSLGLVLYVLLNDFFLPFVREYHEGIDYPQVREACRRRLSGETFSAPKNADESLARVIMRACSPSPENRFPSAYEFGKALNSCLRNTIPNRGTADETVSILSFYNDDKNTFDFSHAFYDNDQNTPDVFPGFTDDSVPPANAGNSTSVRESRNDVLNSSENNRYRENQKAYPYSSENRNSGKNNKRDPYRHGNGVGRNGKKNVPVKDPLFVMKVLGIALIILLLLMLSGIPSLISSRFLDSDAKTVNYTVYYVDDNNVPIGQAVYKGKAGKKITFVARDKDGYTLQNPKQSIVLSENPDENHLTFIYTKTTSVKFRI